MHRLSAFLAALAVLGLVAAVAGASTGDVVVIDQGHFGVQHWFVAGVQDENRKGICFEVGVFKQTPRNGGTGSGQCSAPAVKRGILLAVSSKRTKKPDKATITAVGAALNKAVKAVEVTSFDGTKERLVPRAPASSMATGSTVGNFRYLAFAIKGPWCAERVVTLSRSGEPLWETDWQEIGGDREPHDPRGECPGF